MRRMMILSTICLTLANCAPGDFCDVVKAPLLFDPETSAAIVRTDRADAERIKVQNDYGTRHCAWRQED